MRIGIDRTWDGQLILDPQIVWLDLERRDAGLAIGIDAPFHGDPPPMAPVGSTEGLWEHEVVELFVQGPEAAYAELEFGPHGHYLGLRFTAPRVRSGVVLSLEPTMAIAGARWSCEVLVPWAALPGAPMRGNAFAIHGEGAGRRYLAWQPVRGVSPNFHRSECFAPLVV